MARKKIPTSGPFRYIKKADTTKPFDNRLKPLNKVDFSTLYSDNKGATHVLVYDFQNKILCFLVVDDIGTHFYLNLVETNEIYPIECDYLNPAPKLIMYIETISPIFRYKKVTLASLPQLVPYYNNLGYNETGKTFNDPNYGRLIEMEKIL